MQPLLTEESRLWRHSQNVKPAVLHGYTRWLERVCVTVQCVWYSICIYVFVMNVCVLCKCKHIHIKKTSERRITVYCEASSGFCMCTSKDLKLALYFWTTVLWGLYSAAGAGRHLLKNISTCRGCGDITWRPQELWLASCVFSYIFPTPVEIVAAFFFDTTRSLQCNFVEWIRSLFVSINWHVIYCNAADVSCFGQKVIVEKCMTLIHKTEVHWGPVSNNQFFF